MVNEVKKFRVAVLGASGGVGRLIVSHALDQELEVVCQTRNAEKLADLAKRIDVQAFDPRDSVKLGEFIKGADVVVFALRVDTAGATTLFSDVTAALITAMSREHVKRLIAITGVGAGETRGHGGFLYDWIIELSAGNNDHAIHLIGIAPTVQRQVGVGFESIDGETLPSTRGSAHLDMKAMSFSSPSTSSRLLPTTELMSSLFCFSLGIVGNSSLRLAS